MNATREKAIRISHADLAIQDLGGNYAKQWSRLVEYTFEDAKGHEDGWLGIAEEDSAVIEELYPKVINFIATNNLEICLD